MDISKLVAQSSSEAERSAAGPTVPNYQHQPIAASSQIRILILHPPAPNDPEPLSGELVTVNLEDKPVYEALSYCWGAPDNSESLQLPEDQLSITANLAAGLRQLRFLDQSRRLWVDAICINQRNNVEKGPQVALMAQIFRNAECVLIWLGVGNSVIYEAIEFLKDVADDAKRYGVQPEIRFTANLTRLPNNEERQALTELSNRTNYASLSLFFRQAWFRRLWIVQEFVLASKISLYNGTSTLSYQEFMMALVVFVRMHGIPTATKDLVDSESIFAVGFLIGTRDVFQSRSGEESLILLYEAVEGHCGRERTNDLDLIYGVLGLSTPYQDIELEIDYNIDVEDLLLGSLGDTWSKGSTSRSFPEPINWRNGAQSLQGCHLGCQTGELNDLSHLKELCFPQLVALNRS